MKDQKEEAGLTLRSFLHHMFAVGMDVDKFVFTEHHQFNFDDWEKILLFAGNSFISSPLVFIMIGKIYLLQFKLKGQSAGNFSFSTKASAVTKNTYNKFNDLPLINKPRFRSFFTTQILKNPEVNSELLNANFVTGLVDGEGSFIIRVRKSPNSKLGWKVEATFSICFHIKDIAVLKLLHNYFGGAGNITKSKESALYWVTSLTDLNNVIIPHFDKYPLITQKKADFILFKNVIDLMNRKEHFTIEGLKNILAIKASINRGLPETLKLALPEIIAVQRPIIQDQKINDPNWLAGFTSVRRLRREGSFQINIFKSSTKLGQTIRLFFTITQHSRDEQLMRSLVDYLGCGSVYSTKGRAALDFKVSKINDLTDKVLPFFDKYNIIGQKYLDYQDFKKVTLLIKNGDHLSAKGLDLIYQIRNGMNNGRQLVEPSSSLKGNNLFISPTTLVKSQGLLPGSGAKGRRDFTTLISISEHLPIHKSNLTNEELGHFLAGLIEGDGWFGNKELHIIFSEGDVSLAYLIKKSIGYGNVYKIKDKKAFRYICKHKKGLFKILSLINGKLVSKYKYEQLIKNNYSEIFNISILPPLNSLSLDNYWLAGFTQANGSFHISVVKSKTHKTGYSVRLEFSLKQNDSIPLKLLYDTVKMGNISQYSNGIWCYKSSGFKTAALLINYFDTFNLFANKYVDYLKFRKVYIMITNGKHLEDKGIIKIKSITTKGSSETSTQEVLY
jgi:hypothetical protein